MGPLESRSQVWRVDLHTHTCFSPDSLTQPADLVAQARRVGLDRVAVTDHNSIEGALAAQRIDPELVIVGEEIQTAEGGELIAYFVRELVPSGLPVDEVIARLNTQGAVVSISHPLDRWRGSALGEQLTLRFIDRVDALEVFNARCLSAGDNRRAAALAETYGKGKTAGSDAHTLPEIGRAYLNLAPFDSAESFRRSLKGADPAGSVAGPWPHVASTYAKWVKRLKS